MKQIVLGTAGHIDHGKTALVKALTGIDTDRLKEEKERGITIDIGFAHLQLPSGIALSIVDVPGHERFIRNMLAGAHGIDMVLLVVAADEGVMPQTVEHLDIVTLLGVKRGITVLTKIDLVEEDWLGLVTEELRDFLKGSFLAESPILPVSATTGQGIKELIDALDRVAGQVAARSSAGPLRLPIDRVFTMKGFGTVVTGTLISGQVKVGDLVEILPKGVKAKVRGLQVHNQQVSCASAGMRAAVNLQGIEREALERGDTMVTAGIFTPTHRLEAHVKQLGTGPRSLKRRAPVRLYLGTREVMAHLSPLDKEEIRPGEDGFVQLRLQSPVVASRSDRFVLRSYSPMITIGGGEVLDPNPPRKRPGVEQVASELNTIKGGEAAGVAEIFVHRAGYVGIELQHLAGRSGLSSEELFPLIQGLIDNGRLVKFEREGTWLFHGEIFARLKDQVIELLTQFHRTHPLKEGMSKEELKGRLPKGADARLVGKLLEELSASGLIIAIKDHVKLAGHGVVLEGKEKELEGKIISTLLLAGLAPPTVTELAQTLALSQAKVQDMLSFLTSQGALVKVKEDLFFHAQAIKELEARVSDYLKSHSEISPTQYKELTGASRKFTVPLMEYFDRMRLTIRVGDNRRLRENFSSSRTSNI